FHVTGVQTCALPILMAAENLSKPLVSKIVRMVVAYIRAVPTVLWVLIFAIAAGLGSEAAVLGMLFHSVAYLVKAFSEAFEEVDRSEERRVGKECRCR